MAKMRVHELAKELNIKSQDIIEFLNTTPYAVKSASSGLEDEAQDAVRKNYGKKNTAVDNQGAAKTDAAQQERPKKKSSINAIYNPQYSKQSSQRSGQQSAGKKENAGKSDRPKKETVAAKPETHTIIRPRPVGERAMRPISERTANNKDELLEGLKAQEERNNNERNNGERRERNNNGERNNGERKERSLFRPFLPAYSAFFPKVLLFPHVSVQNPFQACNKQEVKHLYTYPADKPLTLRFCPLTSQLHTFPA